MNAGSFPWSQVRLGDVLQYRDERIELDDMTEYVTITVKRRFGGLQERDRLLGSQIKTKKQFRLISGAFIISRIQCWHQAFAIVPDNIPPNMIASTNYDQFEISPKVDRGFFWWLSHAPVFIKTVRDSASGVVIEKMVFDRDSWLQRSIPMPPIEEQRKIVTRIDEVAGKIEASKALHHPARNEIRSLVSSVVDSMCYRDTYPICLFREVLDEAKNGIYKPPEYWGTGIPCVRMYNIDGPEMNTRNLQFLNVSSQEFAEYECVPGDLIFNRVNSKELVGKTGLIDQNFPRCTFESKNMRLKVNHTKVMPEFAAIILNSNRTRRYYSEVLKKQCGMATLNQTHVRGIPIPLPEIREQVRILDNLRDLRAKMYHTVELQDEIGKGLDSFLPSVVETAMNGQF